MLRLAYTSSSKVLVRAVRAIPSSSIHFRPTAIAFTASAPKFVSRYNFSTNANDSIVDRKLVKALKSEIKSHNLVSPQPPESPADFPFAIREEDDDDSVKLERELNGEMIHVSIAMPKVIQEELKIADADPDVCLPEMITLGVRIGKGNGKSLHFDAVICPHVLYVTKMSVLEPHSDHGRFRSYGEHEVEKDGELQSALQEYLKMRGIKPCYAEFMYRYMVWKSKQATLKTLEGLKKFIKDS